MIVDASAVLAILRDEPDAAFFADALADRAVACRMSAANCLETAIVIDSAKEPVASRRFDDPVARAKVAIEAVTADHAAIARGAYRDDGEGGGHPAQLNFGDCFAYALARSSGEPLLCKGDDFVHTDIVVRRPVSWIKSDA